MIYYFYLPKKAINEATIFYVNIIKEALERKENKVIFKEELDFNLEKEDYILTIRLRDFLKSYVKYKTKNTIYWFQGIQPEEYLMLNNYTFKAKVIKQMLDKLEGWVLRKSKYTFFVSDRMKEHFEIKHSYKIKNDIIMPCFNKQMNEKMFFYSKNESSFVYAGSLFAWQCFDKTIALFKEIQQQIPEASLTILTNEMEKAKIQIESLGIKNYFVKFVPLEDLDQELSKYKYGFIIRDNILINNVSTPTKMSTYLSVGLIPIYTDVIEDFNQNLKNYNYQVLLDYKEDIKVWSEKIRTFNQKDIQITDQFTETNTIFNDYYNISKYITVIRKTINSID
ncbi:hypothetical protein OBK30_12190 [Empedobacter falsenii]